MFFLDPLKEKEPASDNERVSYHVFQTKNNGVGKTEQNTENIKPASS
jgi:hypothetical protein